MSPFSILNSFWLACPLQIFFIKCSKNSCTVEITNRCWCYGVFYFFDHKFFLRSFCCAAFCKNIFVFWYAHMATNFKFRIFAIMLNITLNIRTWLKVDRLYSDCSMISVVAIVNYFIQMKYIWFINVLVFDTAVICLEILFFEVPINLSTTGDFSSLCVTANIFQHSFHAAMTSNIRYKTIKIIKIIKMADHLVKSLLI